MIAPARTTPLTLPNLRLERLKRRISLPRLASIAGLPQAQLAMIEAFPTRPVEPQAAYLLLLALELTK